MPPLDGFGSERAVTNASQGVTASLTLSAFGQTVASTGSSTSAYQYGATSGYRTEGDAGLTLVGCRFYDAQVGRFITRDTYLNQKPYAYCDGDPVNATDPSGHAPPGQRTGTWWQKAIQIIGVLAQGATGGAGGGLTGGLSGAEPQPAGPNQPPTTIGGGRGNDSSDDSTKLLLGSGAVAVGIVIVGLALAPETGGASLILLAAA